MEDFADYTAAKAWLDSIGGRTRHVRDETPAYDAIVAYSPKAPLKATALFESNLTGSARERAYEEAFVAACSEFRRQGAENL